jgi:hypothetical protein
MSGCDASEIYVAGGSRSDGTPVVDPSRVEFGRRSIAERRRIFPEKSIKSRRSRTVDLRNHRLFICSSRLFQ